MNAEINNICELTCIKYLAQIAEKNIVIAPKIKLSNDGTNKYRRMASRYFDDTNTNLSCNFL